jgi:ribosomal protein S24E
MNNLTILRQKENPLFKRKEVEVDFESNVPPKIQEAEEILSKEFSASPESVKIKKIAGRFGARNFIISANVYHSKEDKEKTETKSKKEKNKSDVKTEEKK